ncbi:hypothetical protein [Streptomyces ipomoeae]|uniref:hypothetical protein n=1 Tax=Streptomyces ipomoeae TaxID=103232 RepID=UPI0011464474|nr:hypothetical protein [Streptomyces ipomoeae]MDX2935633.1 hypothetical protein [Streptomyces ipomoeae]TQE15463.1 hypothetical protein SipoB123_43435 [Streptomyces ipomoeae]
MPSTVSSYGTPPTSTSPEPSNLAVAVRVAQTLFADYGDSRRDGFSYPEAYGAEPGGGVGGTDTIAELHRLCRDDYASSADRRKEARRACSP